MEHKKKEHNRKKVQKIREEKDARQTTTDSSRNGHRNNGNRGGGRGGGRGRSSR